MGNLNVTVNYPKNEDYYFETQLVRVNLDSKRKEYLSKGKGFIINQVQSAMKKALKNPDGIYSTRFGHLLEDTDPFMDRYSCDCGFIKKRFNAGVLCPHCGSKVRYRGDDFDYFGFICLDDPYYIIHPNLYKSLEAFFGKVGKVNKDYILDRMLLPKKHINKNGKLIESEPSNLPNEPYFGIGIMEFKEKFDEIMKFYIELDKFKNNAKKKLYYDDIMSNRDKIFTQTIPVYTTLLRPFKEDSVKFYFENTNEKYHIMTKLASVINDNELKIFRKLKPKLQLLYDLNQKYQELYDAILEIEGHKKGLIHNLFGGRYAFTNRDVLIPEPQLKINEISLSRVALCELMQQTIINILKKTYKISYNEAYIIWYKSQSSGNPIVIDIVNHLIREKHGIPVLINRNPTINFGSILYMKVVKIVESYTMGIPLDVCQFLGADFDGDVLNLHYIINEDFRIACEERFDPRNAMCISRNDGWVDSRILPFKDLLINMNTLANESRQYYTPEQKNKLKLLVKKGAA